MCIRDRRKLLPYTPEVKKEEVKKEVKPLVNNDEEKIIKLFDDEDSDDFDLPPLR